MSFLEKRLPPFGATSEVTLFREMPAREIETTFPRIIVDLRPFI
jgi:hypothetical protein